MQICSIKSAHSRKALYLGMQYWRGWIVRIEPLRILDFTRESSSVVSHSFYIYSATD
jgi:hypothetical protein